MSPSLSVLHGSPKLYYEKRGSIFNLERRSPQAGCT
ncbi:uncharacterized protein G2W53_018551 [Senna tora]|uniref:Uncharacterized protein n=1 Tax=Senna tora TaxID=362788 RepID=A0A834TSQ3_9FABA|nr:uncharacterized protein G2W53_018551 [Senna tora]